MYPIVERSEKNRRKIKRKGIIKMQLLALVDNTLF